MVLESVDWSQVAACVSKYHQLRLLWSQSATLGYYAENLPGCCEVWPELIRFKTSQIPGRGVGRREGYDPEGGMLPRSLTRSFFSLTTSYY